MSVEGHVERPATGNSEVTVPDLVVLIHSSEKHSHSELRPRGPHAAQELPRAPARSCSALGPHLATGLATNPRITRLWARDLFITFVRILLLRLRVCVGTRG